MMYATVGQAEQNSKQALANADSCLAAQAPPRHKSWSINQVANGFVVYHQSSDYHMSSTYVAKDADEVMVILSHLMR